MHLQCEIADAFRDDGCFSGVDEQSHQRTCKDKDKERNSQAEQDRSTHGTADAFPDPVISLCPEILCDEDGKCVSKILYRKIGKGVDLHAAAKAAMMVVPKLLTSPWTARIPRFMMDCCIQVRAEKLVISFTRLSLRRMFSSRRIRCGKRMRV